MLPGETSALASYTAVLDARLEHVPGVNGLLMKEKLGGKSVISHSLDRFDEDDCCSEVLVLADPAVHAWITHDPLTFASGKLRLLPLASSLSAAIAAAREPVLVWHSAEWPNWQPVLLDKLRRTCPGGGAAIPGRAIDSALLQRGQAAGEAPASVTAAQDIFGSQRPTPSAVQHVTGLLDAQAYAILESPQVYDRAALHSALTAQAVAVAPIAAAQAADLPLVLLPATGHNFPLRNADALHLMRRLLGESKKPSRDKYGGLGW